MAPNKTIQSPPSSIDIEDLSLRLEPDLRGYFLGPISPAAFIDRFFPPRHDQPQSGSIFQQSVLDPPKSTVLLHSLLTAAIEKLTPGYNAVDTHDAPDLRTGTSPSVSLYCGEDLRTGTTDFSRIRLFVDLRQAESDDAFSDKGVSGSFPFEETAGAAKLVRGTMATHAAAIMGSQFRTCVFSVAIFGPMARLMRWDPAGAIVTEAFNYVESAFLADFLWRFSGASKRAQGHDVTVELLENDSRVPTASRDYLLKANPGHREFLSIKVSDRKFPSRDTDSTLIISSPPSYTHQSPFGRATRPMFAYDPGRPGIVFLKQYWRESDVKRVKEGDTYFRLSSKKVRNIPQFGKGNDVWDSATATGQPFGDQANSSRSRIHKTKVLRSLVLYRMTLETIGVPLTQFKSSRQLVNAVKDAMIAHDDAFFDAKILHCDISVGNIMINVDDGSGMLTDWDLSTDMEAPQDADAKPHRAGTWEFMSARLLSDPHATHSLIDDRESAFWVLLWAALRYLPHNRVKHLIDDLTLFRECSFHTLSESQENSSESPSTSRGVALGGEMKTTFLLKNGLRNPLKFGPRMDAIISKLSAHFNHGYMNLPAFTSNDSPQYRLRLEREWAAQNHRMDVIRRRGWLVEELEAQLDLGPWSLYEPATKHSVPTKPNKKRRLVDDSRSSGPPRSKLRKD